MENLYNILGVDRSANAQEIKAAYRKLAAKHHPDRGGDTKKFQEIQSAYDTLSDPEKRAAYDNPQPSPEQFFRGNPAAEFQDIINHIFNQNFGRGRHVPQRNKNLNIRSSITLEEAFSGKEFIATLTLPSGHEQNIDIKIPPGITDGGVIRFSGLGDDSIPNIPRGDIFLTVEVLSHAEYVRQNSDLIKVVKLNALEAIVGTTINLITLDKKVLEIKIPPGKQHGQMLSINDYGMPNISNPSIRGRLIIQIEIVIPTNLTDEQITTIKTLI